MTLNEIKVLHIVEEKEKVCKRKVVDLLGISTDYAGYILKHLANEGYLGMVDRGIYILLPKGADTLLHQLHLTEAKLEAHIVRLSRESERIKEEIEMLQKHCSAL